MTTANNTLKTDFKTKLSKIKTITKIDLVFVVTSAQIS